MKCVLRTLDKTLLFSAKSLLCYLPEPSYLSNDYLVIPDLEEDGAEDGGLDGIRPAVVAANDDEVIEDSPADCFPEPCYLRFPFLAGDDDAPFWQGWANLRLKTFQLIENKYFETAVITMILLSSLALVR